MAYSKIDNYVASLQRQVADIAGKIKRMQNQTSFETQPQQNYHSGVENKPYNPLRSQTLGIVKMDNPDCGYATETYQSVAATKEKSPVVEGLVFDNNKKFDFRV